MSKVFALQNAAYSDVYGLNATVEIKRPAGFGGIENTTDIQYRTYSSGLAVTRRNFVLSLIIKF